MTTRNVAKMTGLFSAMLMCASIAWASSGTTIGTLVPESVANELRGGCEYSFTFSTTFPVYCTGGSCSTQRPNEFTESGGSKGLNENKSCGSDTDCGTYQGSGDCAG